MCLWHVGEVKRLAYKCAPEFDMCLWHAGTVKRYVCTRSSDVLVACWSGARAGMHRHGCEQTRVGPRQAPKDDKQIYTTFC